MSDDNEGREEGEDSDVRSGGAEPRPPALLSRRQGRHVPLFLPQRPGTEALRLPLRAAAPHLPSGPGVVQVKLGARRAGGLVQPRSGRQAHGLRRHSHPSLLLPQKIINVIISSDTYAFLSLLLIFMLMLN